MFNYIFILVSILAATGSAFNANPALAVMGDKSWLQVQNYYGCGFPLCYQTLDFCGMTYDQHRHKILLFGGGHASQLWNQVEEFDFATLGWKQLYTPDDCAFYQDPANGYGDGGTQRADGSIYPISRHTYDELDMLTDTCLMIMSGTQEGKGNCVNQTQWDNNPYFHDAYVWLFDPGRIKWTRLSKNAFTYGSGNAVDPETDLLYGHNGQGSETWVYDYRTQVRTLLANNTGPNWVGFTSMAYYPVDKTYFYFGYDNVYEFNPRTKVWTTKNPSGTQVSAYSRNVPYDSRNNVFGIFKSGVFSYYSPVTNTWYANPYDTQYPSDPNYHHTIYDPVDNVYINVIESGEQGWTTWAYKLSDTPGKFPGTQLGVSAEARAQNRSGAGLSVYPNPVLSSGPATAIRVHNGWKNNDRLLVYDVKGSLVSDLSGDVRDNMARWNIGNYPAGVYMVTLKSEGSSTHQRIVKLQ